MGKSNRHTVIFPIIFTDNHDYLNPYNITYSKSA